MSHRFSSTVRAQLVSAEVPLAVLAARTKSASVRRMAVPPGRRLAVCLLAGVAAAAVLSGFDSASAVARKVPHSKLIVPGKSIGPVSLGMTRTEVGRAFHHPHRTTSHGKFDFLHYESSDAGGPLTIQLRGHGHRAKVVAITTTARGDYETSRGISYGSDLEALRSAYRVFCATGPGPDFTIYSCEYIKPRGNPTFFTIGGPSDSQYVDGISVASRTITR